MTNQVLSLDQVRMSDIQRVGGKNASLGEMISTATFLGCGVFIFVLSMELFELGQQLRAYIGLAAAVFCILGGLRFTIANLVNKWRDS